ncbi:unnamed protein product [Orchesella dallaii]|uniref:Uncharacterized protein n=1 Tax=Orchesella dallaii TaxID=48710 RepID=A0ABP1RVH6_9HEXA
MTFGCSNILAGVFAYITWLELASDFVASIWTAFFNDKEVNEWAYGIFSIDVVFSISMLYYTGQETCCRTHLHWQNSRRKLSWLCGMSSFTTICLFGVLYYYNIIVLENEELNQVVLVSFFTYLSALGMLALVGACFLCDYFCPEDEDVGDGQVKKGPPPPPGSLESSLAQMVNHVENNPLQKTYTLYSYGQRGEGSPFQVQMGWP